MSHHVLMTGGAGFIGSHLADELLAHGHRVRVLDPLIAQVHGDERHIPNYLNSEVEVVAGDVRDADAVRRALDGIDAVYHFAARVGVGQSMYDIAEYTSVNGLGTAILLEALAKHPVERLVVASSMSVYGEGLYRAADGRLFGDVERSLAQLKAHDWEVRGPDGEHLQPIPTPETKTPILASVYALSKYDQERLCLICGRAYNIPTVALRFFNTYGPRQALANPYTGVMAIFAARLLNNQPPLVFEDGAQQRDFVSVYDVARACRLALDAPRAVGQVINVGSGEPISVREIALRTAAILGKEHIEPQITGDYRAGDIRNCYADITLAGDVLGYTPEVTLQKGLTNLAIWLEGQTAADRATEARAELAVRGLTL